MRGEVQSRPSGLSVSKFYNGLLCYTECISHLSTAVNHTAVWYGKITDDSETTQGRIEKIVFWYKNTCRILLISILF